MPRELLAKTIKWIQESHHHNKCRFRYYPRTCSCGRDFLLQKLLQEQRLLDDKLIEAVIGHHESL